MIFSADLGPTLRTISVPSEPSLTLQGIWFIIIEAYNVAIMSI